MLPVTASASAGACEGTWRSDSLRGGTDDLERVRPQVGLGFLGDARDHALARQTMANEHDTTVAGSRDTAAPGRDRAHLKLKQRKIAHEPTSSSLPVHPQPLFILRPVQCAYSHASSPCRCPVLGRLVASAGESHPARPLARSGAFWPAAHRGPFGNAGPKPACRIPTPLRQPERTRPNQRSHLLHTGRCAHQHVGPRRRQQLLPGDRHLPTRQQGRHTPACGPS